MGERKAKKKRVGKQKRKEEKRKRLPSPNVWGCGLVSDDLAEFNKLLS